MNAQSHAIATAGAHALADASSAGSVDAKRREGTAQDRTTPNGVFALGDSSSILALGDVGVALALGAKVLDKFHGTPKRQTDAGCLEWEGYRDQYGYGVIRGFRVSHLALMLDGRPVTEGLHALHRCDNPPCINPEHLWPGTRSENMQDMVAKGRHGSNAARGDAHYATKVTDAQVREMRETYTGAWGEVSRMARQYGISSNQAGWILQGKKRKNAGGPIHPHVVSARAATEPSDTLQPHANAPSWMRADR